MKELDDVLVHYLDHCYASSSEEAKAAFRRLLECAEPDILSFLIRRERPVDEELARVVDAVCEAYRPDHS